MLLQLENSINHQWQIEKKYTRIVKNTTLDVRNQPELRISNANGETSMRPKRKIEETKKDMQNICWEMGEERKEKGITRHKNHQDDRKRRMKRRGEVLEHRSISLLVDLLIIAAASNTAG